MQSKKHKATASCQHPYQCLPTPDSLVLPNHLALFAKVLIHVLDPQAVGLRRDVVHLLRLVRIVVVHGALVLEERAASVSRVGVEVVAQTLDADAAEDAEDVALVFVELCRMTS